MDAGQNCPSREGWLIDNRHPKTTRSIPRRTKHLPSPLKQPMIEDYNTIVWTHLARGLAPHNHASEKS